MMRAAPASVPPRPRLSLSGGTGRCEAEKEEGVLPDSGSAAAMPEIVIDRTATPDRRIMIVDSFGQRVQMNVDQFRKLAAERVSDRFQTLASL
jgi:hypothetical protein